MDNMNQKEAKWQAWLASSYKDYLIAVACFCVGFFVYAWGNTVSHSGMVMFIGYLILGAPVFLRMLVSRSVGALFFWRDYEVVTTYDDGRKESDGGAQSAALQVLLWIFMLFFCLVIGGIIALLRLVWLTVKSITCYFVVKEKPGFLRSPFAILIAGVIGLALCALPARIGKARGEKARTEISELLSNVTGKTVFVHVPTLKLHAEPSGSSSVVKTLSNGETLTAVGELSGLWLPVEQGWAYAPFVRLKFKENLISPIPQKEYSHQGILSVPMKAKDAATGSPITLESGTEVSVKNCYAEGTKVRTFVEYNKVLYQLNDGSNAELIVPKE